MLEKHALEVSNRKKKSIPESSRPKRTKKEGYTIDLEFRSLLPAKTPEEYEDLKNAIRSEGKVREPLVVWDEKNILLDGHHRHDICKELGILPPIDRISFASRDEAKAWVVRNQLKYRRNLNSFQRIEAALKCKPYFTAKAKENQRASGGAVSRKSGKPVVANKEVAKLAGIKDPDAVRKVENILVRENEPEVAKAINALRRGDAGISIGEAHRLYGKKKAKTPLRLPKGWKTIEEQDMSPDFLSAIKRGLKHPRVPSVVPGTNIKKVEIGLATLYCGDNREIIGMLEFDSIVTDPPYGMNRFCRWDSWSRKRQSDGTWATKDIYKEIDWDNEPPDLTFLLERNVPTMIFGGNFFSLPPSRRWIIWDKCKYGLSFAEVEMCWCSFDGLPRIFKCIPDHVSNRKMSDVHATLKPVEVMKFCISHLPKGSDNIICDPYLGSGTTGVAAIQMGRAFVGIEQNEEYFETACQRLEHTLYQPSLFEDDEE